ncbi:UDP-glycosyltransferase 72E1 [Rosa sericea]
MGDEQSLMSQQQKPHITVLSSPGMGHVTPLIELAKRLIVDHGFQVTVLAITTDAPPAQVQLLNNPSLPSDLHVVHLPQVDVSSTDSGDGPAGVVPRLLYIVQETLRSLRSVLISLQRPLSRALIVDPFCIEALETATDLSIPTYLFLTGSASFLALTMYFPTIHAAQVCRDYSNIGDKVCIPGCKPLWLDDLVPELLIPQLLNLSNRVPVLNGVLVNTWEELEPVTLSAFKENPFFLRVPSPPTYPVGPLTKIDTEPVASTESNLLKWLEKQPPESVVYVSFGSGGTLSAEQMTELAFGLELSGKRFLWVARPPSQANASASFFETGCDDAEDPASFLPDGFLDRTRELGVVTLSWAPQVAVLSHPSVAGFVTHCGWNSVLESIVHGVAMIAWPLYAEQKMNATMLVDEGVAVRIKKLQVEQDGKRIVGRREIETAVRMVMEGEEGKRMRQRARELQSSAVSALSHDGSSSGCLTRLGNKWRDGGTV